MATYTQITTFTNGTTADGGQVDTEIRNLGASVNSITNDQVSASAAIAISKTALGTYTAPTAYTVTWTATGVNPVLGNGGMVGRYSQIGKLVFVTISYTKGSTDTLGTGQWIFSLPVNADTTVTMCGSAYASIGSASYDGVTVLNSASTIKVFGRGYIWDATGPAAWGNGESTFLTLTYLAS